MDRIRFVAWNMYGIDNDVLNDDMFNSYLDDNDIVILLETWLEENISIRETDFFVHHALRPKHAKAIRPSGGICVLIKRNICGQKSDNNIHIIKKNDFMIWLRFDKEHFNLKKRFICDSGIFPTRKFHILWEKPSRPF